MVAAFVEKQWGRLVSFSKKNWDLLLVAFLAWACAWGIVWNQTLSAYTGGWLIYGESADWSHLFVTSDQMGILGLQIFYAMTGSGQKAYDLAFYLYFYGLSLLQWIFAIYLIKRREQVHGLLFFVLMALFVVVAFSPFNYASSPAAPYVVWSIVLGLGVGKLYFWYRDLERPLIWQHVLFGCVTFFYLFLFDSYFSFAAVALVFVVRTYRLIRDHEFHIKDIVAYSVLILPIALRFIFYYSTGNPIISIIKKNPYTMAASYFTSIEYAYVPTSYGVGEFLGFQIRNGDYLYLADWAIPLIKALGAVNFTVVIVLILVGGWFRWYKKSYWYHVLVVSFLFSLLYLAFNCHSFAPYYEGIRCLVSVILIPAITGTLLESLQTKSGRRIEVHGFFQSVFAVPLTLVVCVCSLSGWSTMNRRRYWTKDEEYAAFVAGRMEDVTVATDGTTCYRLDVYDTMALINRERKALGSYFSGANVTHDVFTTGIHFDAGDFNGSGDPFWTGDTFRTMISSEHTGTLFFEWILEEQQLGGYIVMYVDGELKYRVSCNETEGKWIWPFFNPNENYFIQCYYEQPEGYTAPEGRSFQLKTLRFGVEE